MYMKKKYFFEADVALGAIEIICDTIMTDIQEPINSCTVHERLAKENYS